MPERTNILYLCTGNSCRSQMAEGWTRRIGGERIAVHSAGIEAHGHAAIVEACRRADRPLLVDASGQGLMAALDAGPEPSG